MTAKCQNHRSKIGANPAQNRDQVIFDVGASTRSDIGDCGIWKADSPPALPCAPSIKVRAGKTKRSKPIESRSKWKIKKLHENHSVDPTIEQAFRLASNAIEEWTRKHVHARVCRLNILLTVNTGWLANTRQTRHQDVKADLLNRLRSAFRRERMELRGISRIEAANVGVHFHLALQGQRGTRVLLARLLHKWTDDPIGASSTRFDRATWHITSHNRTWDLHRVYDVVGLIKYLAKVPLTPDGSPMTRGQRLAGLGRVREFETFGVPTNHV